MTRADAADILGHILVGAPCDGANEALTMAREMLGRTCGTCAYSGVYESHGNGQMRSCRAPGVAVSYGWPLDGSGYCHRWGIERGQR